MDKAQENMAEYICGYVDNNEVGEKGCRHLSKVAWGEPKVIWLSYCSLTQATTKLVIRAAGTSLLEAGWE